MGKGGGEYTIEPCERAGRGIGREIALTAAAEGAKVVVNDLGGATDGSGADVSAAQAVADEIVDFYESEGLDGDAAEALALRDLRQQMIDQLAFAAANNREQNRQRQRARSRAFNALVAALALAFVLVGTIYSVQIMNAAAQATTGPAAAKR